MHTFGYSYLIIYMCIMANFFQNVFAVIILIGIVSIALLPFKTSLKALHPSLNE